MGSRGGRVYDCVGGREGRKGKKGGGSYMLRSPLRQWAVRPRGWMGHISWNDSLSGRELPYLSLQFPATPVVPVQRMMMLEVRDGPVQ